MGKYEGCTPGEWKVRAMPDGGTGYEPDTFVEAPQAKGMAYGLDVCGDDYEGYGGAKVRNANMRLIADAPKLARKNEELREAMNKAMTFLDTELGDTDLPDGDDSPVFLAFRLLCDAALASTEPEAAKPMTRTCPNCHRQEIDEVNAHGLCVECYGELCLIEGRGVVNEEDPGT